jgi:hypothetical protein
VRTSACNSKENILGFTSVKAIGRYLNCGKMVGPCG